MLSWDEVLRYCKTSLGFPHHFIEYSDEEILEYLKEQTLRKFSTFFPEKWTLAITTTDPNVKVIGRQDLFYVNDCEGRQILSLDELIPPGGDGFVLGHPVVGSYSYGSVPGNLIDMYTANNTRPFSDFNYTMYFFAPNMVRITPRFSGQGSIEYSRVHAEDLSTIAPDLQDYFKELNLAVFMMWIGTIRTNFSGINTPFGEIPLNGDDLFSRGESKYQALMDKFETSSAPYLIFDKG